jgi:DNA-binding NarL/FixJ family response regulator
MALEEAQSVARTTGLLGWLWRIHAARAGLEQRRRRSEFAAQQLAIAVRVVEDLAEQLPDDPAPSLDGRSLRGVFAERARARMPRLGPPTPARAEKANYAGLTAREREITALVAAGHSNREIAERLVLSERTVETHVSNVFSKLGYNSRAQLAAWAVERGLRP